jgi:hypothetical protein
MYSNSGYGNRGTISPVAISRYCYYRVWSEGRATFEGSACHRDGELRFFKTQPQVPPCYETNFTGFDRPQYYLIEMENVYIEANLKNFGTITYITIV